MCELAAHPDFPRLMADLEIYVNSIAGKLYNWVKYQGGGIWGGIGKPIFYLNEFAHMDKQTPTSTDKNILKEIISISSVMSDHATGIMLCKKIQESKLLPCNKGEIIGILETLAICGILETPEHKGYIHSFTPPLMRDTGDLRQSLSYPLNWWCGEKDPLTNAKKLPKPAVVPAE